MLWSLAVALFCIVSNSLTASIKLQYSPTIPLQQTTLISIETKESLPVLNVSTQAQQLLKFDLVPMPASDAPMAAAPARVVFALKDYFVDLSINREKIAVDPKSGNGPGEMMQLSKLISKPLILVIDANGCLIPEPQQVESILKEFPGLKEINLQAFLNELLYSMFALSGKDIDVGAVFHQKLNCEGPRAFPEQITYEIVRITDKEVAAAMRGVRSPVAIAIDAPVTSASGNRTKVEAIVSGELKGTISWNRQNAMLYNANTEFSCRGQLKAGQMQWGMDILVTHKSSTSK